jgi:hypothetical protein
MWNLHVKGKKDMIIKGGLFAVETNKKRKGGKEVRRREYGQSTLCVCLKRS